MTNQFSVLLFVQATPGPVPLLDSGTAATGSMSTVNPPEVRSKLII